MFLRLEMLFKTTGALNRDSRTGRRSALLIQKPSRPFTLRLPPFSSPLHRWRGKAATTRRPSSSSWSCRWRSRRSLWQHSTKPSLLTLPIRSFYRYVLDPGKGVYFLLHKVSFSLYLLESKYVDLDYPEMRFSMRNHVLVSPCFLF